MSRRWLFRVVLVALPWLFLLALELALRALGVGVAMDFTLPRPVAGERRQLSNPHFTWLFFDPAVARILPPFSLAESKPAGTIRVFVLGSSAAQGDPEPGFGLARVLEVLLREQYPGIEFDVVNAAATAVNSHAVYVAAGAALRLEPDLFVVYEGNNEVVGPYGAGTVLTAAAPDIRLVRASVALRSTRLGQLVGAAVRGVAGGLGFGQAPGAWHGMEMFLERQLRRSDPALERAYGNYERNLADVCALSRRAGVQVALCTVAVNLRNCGPFASTNDETLAPAVRERWRAQYDEGARLQAAGRCDAALTPLRAAQELDPEHADTAYRLARCEAALGHEAPARALFLAARDRDTLRFRADARINAIVRDLAGRSGEGVRLVDAERRLAESDALGAPGSGLFLDHVHLTFHGNYRLAAAVMEQARALLPAWVRERASGRPPLDEEACARALVYTDLDRYRVAETMQQRLRDAPFTAQSDHDEQVRRFADELAALRARGEAGGVEADLRAYEQALARPGVHWTVRERHAALLQRLGDAAAALGEWQQLARLFPQHPAFQLQLARSLREAARFDEASGALRHVLDYQPDAPVALVEAARLALAQGRREEAIAHARRALAGDPRDASALQALAGCLCPRHDCTPRERGEAVTALERAAKVAPESQAIRRELDALQRTGHPQDDN